MLYRILVIEDSEDDYGLLCRVLDNGGFKHDRAKNGTEGLRLLGACKYHAVMMDLKLPDINGFDLIRRIKLRCPETPVCVITGLDDPRVTPQIIDAGAVILFKKPFNSMDNLVMLSLLSSNMAILRKGRREVIRGVHNRTTAFGLISAFGTAIAGIPLASKPLGFEIPAHLSGWLILPGLMMTFVGTILVGFFAADAKKLKDYIQEGDDSETESKRIEDKKK